MRLSCVPTTSLIRNLPGGKKTVPPPAASAAAIACSAGVRCTGVMWRMGVRYGLLNGAAIALVVIGHSPIRGDIKYRSARGLRDSDSASVIPCI